VTLGFDLWQRQQSGDRAIGPPNQVHADSKRSSEVSPPALANDVLASAQAVRAGSGAGVERVEVLLPLSGIRISASDSVVGLP
jgi:hypothetical protein